MTASEFAFLALGLVLGVASGAALIEVLRARPPVAREVRVTVAPNAIHARSTTLADPHGSGEGIGPAAGGPADRRWRDEIATTGEPAAPGRRVGRPDGRPAAGPPSDAARPDQPGGAAVDPFVAMRTPVRTNRQDPADHMAPAATPRAADPSPVGRPVMAVTGADDPARRPAPLWLQPTAAESAGLVAVPMALEPDPITAALRATAAASAVAAMRGSTSPAAVASGGNDEPGGRAEIAPEARARGAGRGGGSAGGGPAGGGPAGGGAAGGSAPASGDTGGATGGDTGGDPTGQPPADGPCADERRVAEERCAVAVRARDGAAAAADSLRRAQRTYDDHVARAEAAAAAADPRAVRQAKELAQHQFREARNDARTRDDVEAGARAWLAEINRINHDTREATLARDRDQAAATALAAQLERLAVEADAARISAERADEACLAAREAVAACDEARTLADAAARSGETAPGDGDEEAGGGNGGRIAAATPGPEDEFSFSTPMHSRPGQDALILQILRGDREAMQRVIARLAGDDPEALRRWQSLLGGLMEALIARSIEATAFDFPVDHFFWGPFTQSQNRDIAAGLSSLGFRFDGFGGWVDDRVPSQRDLSLAVGYAGLDPMRVRHWPNEAETVDLLRDVRVAADDYVAGAAGGLTLGELVTLLGRRADGLTELWNEWGAVRPILLEGG